MRMGELHTLRASASMLSRAARCLTVFVVPRHVALWFGARAPLVRWRSTRARKRPWRTSTQSSCASTTISSTRSSPALPLFPLRFSSPNYSFPPHSPAVQSGTMIKLFGSCDAVLPRVRCRPPGCGTVMEIEGLSWALCFPFRQELHIEPSQDHYTQLSFI